MALNKNDPLYKNLAASPLRNAVLRLKDSNQKIIAEMALEREQARLRVEALHSGRRTIMVTTDLSAGFGSYAGPTTELLEVIEDRLEPVVAQDTESGSREPILLVSTLKTSWKLVPAAGGRSDQKDILEVACRPNLDAKNTDDFLVTYMRFHWNGEGWSVLTRKVHEFWEDEGPFPAQQLFPSATK